METGEKEEKEVGSDIVSVADVKMLESLLPALEGHAKNSEKNAESIARIADAFERIAKVLERGEQNMQHIIEQQYHAVR